MHAAITAMDASDGSFVPGTVGPAARASVKITATIEK
jgi:hypothetical protein